MFQKRVNLFGLWVDDVSLLRAVEMARTSFLSGERRIFFTPNLEMLEMARRDGKIRDVLNFATVSLPDGDGLLLASRLVDAPVGIKVAGIDFGEGLIDLCERESKKVFLLGGGAGVAKKAAKKLIKRHPKLKICGIHHGYFPKEEESLIIKKIQSSSPDVLIVCAGFPKQEKFVYDHRDDLDFIRVIACLGGALDIWSGKKIRAPEFVRRARLEWLWRILSEPHRAKRFIASLPALFCAAGIKIKK